MAKRQTSKWQVTSWAPMSWRKVLMLYALEHNTSVMGIVREALREWADRRKLSLPSA